MKYVYLSEAGLRRWAFSTYHHMQDVGAWTFERLVREFRDVPFRVTIATVQPVNTLDLPEGTNVRWFLVDSELAGSVPAVSVQKLDDRKLTRQMSKVLDILKSAGALGFVRSVTEYRIGNVRDVIMKLRRAGVFIETIVAESGTFYALQSQYVKRLSNE